MYSEIELEVKRLTSNAVLDINVLADVVGC